MISANELKAEIEKELNEIKELEKQQYKLNKNVEFVLELIEKQVRADRLNFYTDYMFSRFVDNKVKEECIKRLGQNGLGYKVSRLYDSGDEYGISRLLVGVKISWYR